MKKIYIMCLLAVAAISQSCSKDESLAMTLTSSSDGGTQEMSFSGSISDEYDILETEELDAENRQGGTRAAFSTETMVGTWDVNDRVSINDGVLSCVYKVEQGGDVSCAFRVSSSENMFTGADENSSFCAFYPATAVAGWYDGTVTALIYAEQDYAENMPGDAQRFGGYYISSRAAGDKGKVTFNFSLAASIVDIDISTLGKTAQSVSIKSNSGVSLSGKFSYDCTSANPVIAVRNNDATDYTASTQSDVVTVFDIPEGAEFVRFYVLPVQLIGGLTITVKDTDGNYYTKLSSKDIGGTLTGLPFSVSGVTGGTACMPYYKKVKFGAADTAKRLNNWMACVPGNIPFTRLSLAGTHDAATKGSGNAAETQSLSLQEQLNAGVRALDLRPYATNGVFGFGATTADNMTIHHGVVDTNVKFKDALSTIATFLADNPTETIYVQLHEEDGNNLDRWRTAVLTCLNNVSSSIKTISGSMKLSDCRGKMVIISRDNVGDTDLCGKCGWGSSFGDKTIFYGSDSRSQTGWIMYYQDEYTSGVYANRMANIKQLISAIKSNITNHKRFYVNTTNTENNIKTYAKATNKAFVDDAEIAAYDGSLCIMFSDYVGNSEYSGDVLLRRIIDQNYRYVFRSRSRRGLKHSGSGIIDVRGDEYAKGDGEVF